MEHRSSNLLVSVSGQFSFISMSFLRIYGEFLTTITCLCNATWLVFCNYYRLSKSNMFLGGIWCSAKKPPTVTVVKPTVTELCALEMEGIILCDYIRSMCICVCSINLHTQIHILHVNIVCVEVCLYILVLNL